MADTEDLVIRGGTVGTSSDVFAADVGIVGETIVALGNRLAPGKRTAHDTPNCRRAG